MFVFRINLHYLHGTILASINKWEKKSLGVQILAQVAVCGPFSLDTWPKLTFSSIFIKGCSPFNFFFLK